MIKKIKGILLFLVSLAVAASLLLSPSSTTAATFLPYIGVTLVSLSIYFVISGVMNLIIVLTNARWNAIWFVPYLLYTGLFWLLFASTGFKMQILQLPAMLSLLTVYLVLDIAEEYKESKSADDRHSGTSGGSASSGGRNGASSAGDIPVSTEPDKKV